MTPMDGNRLVGGLWCTDVLGLLSAYLDGELEPGVKTKVDAHLGECGNCARFGAEIAGMLEALARQREDLTPDAAERLKRAIGEGPSG